MCLIVKEVPATLNDGAVVQCYKDLLGRQTWYKGYTVPTHGWLIPVKFQKVKIFLDNRVHSGVIHAYSRRTYSGVHVSYAINVLAYGEFIVTWLLDLMGNMKKLHKSPPPYWPYSIDTWKKATTRK